MIQEEFHLLAEKRTLYSIGKNKIFSDCHAHAHTNEKHPLCRNLVLHRRSKVSPQPSYLIPIAAWASQTESKNIYSYPSEFLYGADKEGLISWLAFYVSGIYRKRQIRIFLITSKINSSSTFNIHVANQISILAIRS